MQWAQVAQAVILGKCDSAQENVLYSVKRVK